MSRRGVLSVLHTLPMSVSTSAICLFWRWPMSAMHSEAGMTEPVKPRKRVDATEGRAIVKNGAGLDEHSGEEAAQVPSSSGDQAG